jgi:hypothetical protein
MPGCCLVVAWLCLSKNFSGKLFHQAYTNNPRNNIRNLAVLKILGLASGSQPYPDIHRILGSSTGSQPYIIS